MTAREPDQIYTQLQSMYVDFLPTNDQGGIRTRADLRPTDLKSVSLNHSDTWSNKIESILKLPPYNCSMTELNRLSGTFDQILKPLRWSRNTHPTILLPGIDPGTPTYKIDMITISNIGVYTHPTIAPTQDRTGVDGS